MKGKLRSTACILLATLIWGTAFVAQSVGMDHIGPFTFQTVRCALAVIGLLPVVLIADKLQKKGSGFWRRWLDKKLWKAGLLCGIPLFFACNLQQLGLAGDTDAGKSGFLTAMYIVIVPVLGIFLKRKPTVMVPISVSLAVAGLYFLSFAGVPQVSTGDLLTLACAFMFAVQILCVDLFAQEVDPLRLNTIQALVGSVLAFFVMLLTETPTLAGITACAVPLAYTGFLSMGAAYSLQILGQKGLEPTAASLIMSMEAVVAVLAGWLLLGERFSFQEGIGCVLVFIAVILSQLPVPIKKKQEVS